MWQEIAIYIILGITLICMGYKVYKSLFSSDGSLCDHCASGCALKELKQKNKKK